MTNNDKQRKQFQTMLTSLFESAQLTIDKAPRMSATIGSKRSKRVLKRQKTKLGYIGAKQVAMFWIAYNFRCVTCECMLSEYKGFTLGHLVAVETFLNNGKQVNNSKFNICLQCRECNSRQGKKAAYEFFDDAAIARVYAAIERYDNITAEELARWADKAASESSQFAKKFDSTGRLYRKYHSQAQA